MHVITPQDLDLYPIMDLRHVKMIDADYNVRVGYWASRSNAWEYKFYAIMIRMFYPNF